MRDETKRAAESLLVGLIVGVLHLLWRSRATGIDHGGGVTMLLGCVFTTGVLWAMLALRSLAADGKPEPEVDDGVTSMAVTAWVMALVPPRATNFLSESGVDDFTRVYLPVALLAVFVMLAAQALWKPREPRLVARRLVASAAVCFFALAGLVFFVAKGPGAEELATRGVLGGVLAGGATLVRVVLGRRGR